MIFLEKPISVFFLAGALIFLLLPKLLARSKQFQMARKIAAEDAA